MRRISIFALVILMAGTASAGVFITVEGEMNPDPIVITINDVLDIGLWGDGEILVGGLFFMGVETGSPATFDISSVNILYTGWSKWVIYEEEQWIADYLDVEYPALNIQLSDPVMPPETPTPLLGQLVENIWLSPTTVGLITLNLFDGDGEPIDSEPIAVQQIYVLIPEPTTLVLLGLGALILKRRR
ncbi:MAG: PEP-CTERM sorting domain-containing protein [Sedimentisphaerales bacterium]|nr:PEP-CTERM sorting domain-containing protein [Sedimentisphaerales bacterium]